MDAGTPFERALALADEAMYAQKTVQYQRRAAAQQDPHVRLDSFAQFLQVLHTTDGILDIGLRKAADLAGFETWLYVQTGEPHIITFHEHADGEPLQARQTVTAASNRVVTAVMEARGTIWASDYETSAYADPLWVSWGNKSFIAAPVTVNGAVTGVVAFSSRQHWHAATPAARHLLELVAAHLERHFERQDTYLKMQASVEAGITGMGVLLEMRDLETAGHTARVVDLALRLGTAAGLGASDLTHLRLGAYLHDVGKLAVPDAVLLKPGPLDPAEWAVMQTHAEIGAALAAKLPSIGGPALDVVHFHHERWDGTGYPRRLAGPDIPHLARLFSICDVFDALVSPRPYKRAWTSQEARAELISQKGRQFDPELVELFLTHVLSDADTFAELQPAPVRQAG